MSGCHRNNNEEHSAEWKGAIGDRYGEDMGVCMMEGRTGTGIGRVG